MIGERWTTWVAFILLLMAAALFLAPIGWMVSTAFKPENKIVTPIPRWALAGDRAALGGRRIVRTHQFEIGAAD